VTAGKLGHFSAAPPCCVLSDTRRLTSSIGKWASGMRSASQHRPGVVGIALCTIESSRAYGTPTGSDTSPPGMDGAADALGLAQRRRG
jgi:hypothetical protein